MYLLPPAKGPDLNMNHDPLTTPTLSETACSYVRNSTKYVPSCELPEDQHIERPLWPLLITGTGRSGTLYTAKVGQYLRAILGRL